MQSRDFFFSPKMQPILDKTFEKILEKCAILEEIQLSSSFWGGEFNSTLMEKNEKETLIRGTFMEKLTQFTKLQKFQITIFQW
jgi:hypothetical protein